MSTVINVGNNNSGYNGEGISAPDAWLDRPFFLQFTPAGDLLIVERESHRIRLWNRTDNTISSMLNKHSIEGTPFEPFFASAAINLRARNPMQVVNAASGFIFADENNYALRQVFPDGSHRVIAGTALHRYAGDGGAALQAKIQPERLAIDSDSNLYIMQGDRVRKLTCIP